MYEDFSRDTFDDRRYELVFVLSTAVIKLVLFADLRFVDHLRQGGTHLTDKPKN